MAKYWKIIEPSGHTVVNEKSSLVARNASSSLIQIRICSRSPALFCSKDLSRFYSTSRYLFEFSLSVPDRSKKSTFISHLSLFSLSLSLRKHFLSLCLNLQIVKYLSLSTLLVPFLSVNFLFSSVIVNFAQRRERQSLIERGREENFNFIQRKKKSVRRRLFPDPKNPLVVSTSHPFP